MLALDAFTSSGRATRLIGPARLLEELEAGDRDVVEGDTGPGASFEPIDLLISTQAQSQPEEPHFVHSGQLARRI